MVLLHWGLHPHFWKSTGRTLWGTLRLKKPAWGLVPVLVRLYGCWLFFNQSWSSLKTLFQRTVSNSFKHFVVCNPGDHYRVEFLPGSGQNQGQHFPPFFPALHPCWIPCAPSRTSRSLLRCIQPPASRSNSETIPARTLGGRAALCTFSPGRWRLVFEVPSPCRRPKAEGTYRHILLRTPPPASAVPPVRSQPVFRALAKSRWPCETALWTNRGSGQGGTCP